MEWNYKLIHNNLWDVGVKDDKFALIAKLDENAEVVVKTPCGVTDQFNLKRLVMQGSVFGPIKCSVQMDTLGRDCLANGDGIYKYKDTLETPALAMIDDIIGVSKCNDESVELNSIINVKIESKKLRLSETKCVKLHVSRKPKVCSTIIRAHEKEISAVKTTTYLGDVLSEDGSVDATIESRRNKSIGIISQISSVLTSISLGFFFFDIALTLRESMFVNGILTNSDIWYNFTKEHIKVLESQDIQLMRKILNAHSKTASELFFIETAKLPLRFVISKRRLMYLWHILTRTENELIKKVYALQKVMFTKGDWYGMIQQEKIRYDINLTDEEISKMSKYRFKSLDEKKVKSVAFEYLKEKASKHSKSKNILEESKSIKTWRIKSYLKENIFTKVEQQLLFQLKSKMLDVKTNFRKLYDPDLICRTCKNPDSQEDEDHLLKCESLVSEVDQDDQTVEFNFVYKDIGHQKQAVKVFKSVLRKREILLKYEKS